LKPDKTVAHQSIYRAVGRHPVWDTRIHAIRNEVLGGYVRYGVWLIEYYLIGCGIRSSKSPHQQSGKKWRDHKCKQEPIDSVSTAPIGNQADDKCQPHPKRDNPKQEISPIYPTRNLTARRPAVASTLLCITLAVGNLNTMESYNASVLGTLSVPIYQGGAEYSLIREAKETLGQRRLDFGTRATRRVRRCSHGASLRPPSPISRPPVRGYRPPRLAQRRA
jgi:hypothetical protein